METNLTLNVGYFSGPAALNTGEIVGISITMILVVMIILVIVAVLVLKVRPGGALARGKQPGSSSHEMSFTTVEAAHNNGSVVINGTTYSGSNPGSNSGLTNGYINPDVIPALHSPQEQQSVEMVQNRLNTSTAGGSQQRYENLPLPVTSVGVEAVSQENYGYSPQIMVRHSQDSDRSVRAGLGWRINTDFVAGSTAVVGQL